MNADEVDFDPFNAQPDPERAQAALIRSLQVADGFVLIFAVTNSATERDRRMSAVSAEVSNKAIQHVGITTETYNLLWYLRDTQADPKPDAMFVYGFENWISGAVNPRSIPFLLNLNAARDSFPLVIPVPMVLWVPQYVLNAIAEAAPDFFSIRSGVYTFPIEPNERDEAAKVLTQIGLPESMSFSLPERIERIHELEGLLSEYRSLPSTERNHISESHLMSRIGLQLEAEGRYNEAEVLFIQALSICKEFAPNPSSDLGAALNNVAKVYMIQGRYGEAEPLFEEALKVARSVYPFFHSDIATVLNNYGSLHKHLSRFSDAEKYYLEALSIHRELQSAPPHRLIPVLNNLSSLYMSQRRYKEAEELQVEAVNVSHSSLPYPHVDTAASINNLAINYHLQGRYVEALQLYDESSQIVEVSLGSDHPFTKTAKKNINNLIRRIMTPSKMVKNSTKELLPMRLPINKFCKRPK